MTTVVEAQANSRLQILPSGVRLVRLGANDHGWLQEYRPILLRSAEDFLRRSQLAGTPEGVLGELDAALEVPWRAVWLVLHPDYRLIGFALAEMRASFGEAPEVFAVGMYLYPRRVPRAVFPALVQAMLGWGRSHGATRGTFQTQRTETRAWRRIGARPRATLYEIPLMTEGD
jgi:GNAT superfamily N-acetyltransferase